MFTVNIYNHIIGHTVRRNLVNYNSANLVSAISNVRCNSNAAGDDKLTNLEFRNITKDRSNPVPVEASIRYINSDAYKITYGNEPVWTQYRRNHKGAFAPRKTRKTCVRQNVISTGSPCPICRDEYLVLNENNTELLKQFISPHTGGTLSYQTTGLCQKRHQELLIAIQRARNRGLLTFDVPFRKYNYKDYYSPQK